VEARRAASKAIKEASKASTQVAKQQAEAERQIRGPLWLDLGARKDEYLATEEQGQTRIGKT